MPSPSHASPSTTTPASTTSYTQYVHARGSLPSAEIYENVAGTGSRSWPEASGATNKQQQSHPDGTQQTFTIDTFDLPQTAVPLLEPPGPRASDEEKKDFLLQQLDSFGKMEPMFENYLSLGGCAAERVTGGAHSCLQSTV